MQTCIRCGRKLKDKRSIERKFGPKCFKKWQKEREEVGLTENQMTIEDVAQ
ncbi:DUF6011 domain-containing protein [Oceanobacillus alkalisoli]|uniref:DUF6011 domain-containing protein n=1 Tax=Oceanobacillus alkalisoli TaxID=2925113 RepID=UPI001F11F886|nr:DUF6011 domain-containing protein [Oceanobacillus alkalisoli]MCF3942181.1 DUF6011 domain-containing protein [Oceanobacillus alkalisoli]